MFQILWKPMVDEDKLIEYKVSIKPPDAVTSTLIIKNKNKPFFITFSGLVPGRAYTISEERFDQDNKPSLLSSNVLRTLPLRPVVIIDKDSITISGFKITWTPPRDVSEFDRYILSFTTETLPIEKTFEKSDQLEYDIHDNVLPGHTYIVIVKTISGKTLSKPAAVYVTLRPLPVEELKITRNNQSQVVSAVWDINSTSHQDTFMITYKDEDSLDTRHQEMSANQKEIILRNLLPGRKYFIQVMAVSHGMESVATSVSYITPPLAPLVEVTPDSYGLDLVWSSDIKYGQVAFKVEYHRMDSVDNTSTSVLTNDTQLVINNLYPGALYSVQVTSISKYGHQSTSREVYQTVCPRPPNHVTARFVNTSTISVGWETPNLSLISGYLIQYQTEEEKQWMRFDVENTELSKLTTRDLVNLLPGERYLIQVSSVSNTTQSQHVQISWTTPPRPVTHVAALVSPYIVTLKFPRAPGRVELYNITWQGNDTRVRCKEVLYQPAVGTKFVLVNIDGLVPGLIYTFSITSVSYNMHSSVTNVSAQTWPLGSDILLDNSASPFSLILNYIPPLVRNFDMFCFNLSAPASRIPTIEKSVNDNNTRVSFDPVIPGELYHVTVWTASEHELSVPTIVQYRLHPESITKINITEVTNMTVTLSWEIPHGVYSAFEVDYERGSLRTSEPNITITALKPYHNYTFTLTVLAGTKSSLVTKSSPTSVRAQTLESFPGKVRVFYPIEIHAHNITFVWYLSESDYHGVITKFTLSHRMEGTSDWSSVEYAPSKDHGVVTGLNPGRKYTFKIQACTQVGPGPEVVCIEDMPPLPPPPPSHDIFPQTRLHTSSTIEIRFHKNFFSDDNGPILYYTIIVAEDLSKNSALLKMPSWSDVQSFRIWPPYQVLEPCQFFTNTSEVDFTIGRETCPNEAHYCNGPLKQGTTYRVKVRAFTSPELFTDTIYSPPVSTGKDVSWLLVMGFLVLIVLPVLFIIIRRKIVGVTSPRAGGIRGWLPRMSVTRRDTCHPSQDVTLHNCSHPIPVTLFCTMTLDPDWIAVEFEDLKSVGRGQPTTAAELRCNRPKNRYTNIFPYDSSRYKLQPVDDEEGSDYVNANYIGGYLSPRQYIATQGPLCSTVDDFWRMCWESRTPAIVMLTQCIEKHRDKCYKYWPSDQHPMRCADIEISLQDVCHYGSWVLSELRMCRGGEHRMISHYHFTTWPDSGVPSSPNTLVSFVLSFRTHISPAQHPIVVHCSAGVGRTGTFIALDTVLQRLHNSEGAGSVDILRIVHGLRRQRVLMVQSLAQYVYIYECVQVYLQGGVRHEERQIQNNEAIERDEGVDDL
ncbi:hypothetical protein M8J76_003060 [Diaphorina citri]|nr:hypothetical protein M8J76_003060 [Diaphorina citri]